MKKIMYAGFLCMVLALTGCKKRYVSPLETPIMTKAAEDKEYDFDYIQMNNDVIETLQDQEVFSYLKNLDISGDNDKKEIVLEAEITENVSEDAIEFFLSEATKAIVDAAHTQDFRIDEWTDDGFGNLFDIFSYKIKVTCNGKIEREENLDAGDSVPFDTTLTLEQVIG